MLGCRRLKVQTVSAEGIVRVSGGLLPSGGSALSAISLSASRSHATLCSQQRLSLLSSSWQCSLCRSRERCLRATGNVGHPGQHSLPHPILKGPVGMLGNMLSLCGIRSSMSWGRWETLVHGLPNDCGYAHSRNTQNNTDRLFIVISTSVKIKRGRLKLPFPMW